jgi:outer membrane receptor protein involved in Fe transport
MKRKPIAAAVAVVLGASSFAVTGGAAFAQEGADEPIEEIITTGSRIPRQDLEGPSPVSIYDRSNIEQSGATSIGQMLREIPAVAGAAQSTNINNGGSGSQNISLRGLGSTRTLVLINGRRAPDSSGGNSGLVDLNTIPVAMVERVEVLKDGASAIYGSDAIAGVVNIILRDDFEGIELAAQTGISAESDGEKHEFSITIGQNIGEGNFVVSATRVEESETVAGNRDWASYAGWVFGGEWTGGGSSAPPWGRYRGTTDFGDPIDQAGTLCADEDGCSFDLTYGPDNSGGNLLGGLTAFNFGTDAYNYAPINFQRQPNERWIINAAANMPLDGLSNLGMFESTRAFTEIQFIDRESAQALAEQPLAPLAFYGFSAPYSADNAYNPTGEDISDWRRRLVEGGPRTGNTEIQQIRGVFGFEGELTNGMTWEAAFNYGEVDYVNDYGPLFDLNKVAMAVGPTAVDGDGGLRCDTDGDGEFTSADDAACVPLNTFGIGAYTQEMADYVSFRQLETNKMTQKVASLNVTKADLFELPGGDVGMAFGYVQRTETGAYTPDGLVLQLSETGAVTGTPSDPTDGSYTVDEVYVEFRVPVLDMLEFDMGARYSDYDTFGDTTNWKVGMQLRPIDDLLIRGSAATSFRAPTVSNLFGGAGISFPSVNDPCASNPTQNCINDGVPAGGFTQISTQVRTLVGGNPTVEPEEADTFTFGFVYQPSALEGVAIAVDYWDIDITNPITTVGAGVIMSQCAETGEFCDKIDRFGPGPNQGAPLLIDNRITNAGRVETSGYDLLIEWKGIETGIGDFGVHWEGSIIDTYDKTQANGVITPHAGYFRDDEDGHFAEFRWRLGALYERGPFTAQLDYRWIDEVTEFQTDIFGSCWDSGAGEVSFEGVNRGMFCVTPSNPESVNDLGKFQHTLDSASYVDLYMKYQINEQWTVYLGVDNLLDEEPPVSIDGFNDNTDVRTFDTIGQYYYTGIRLTL